MRSNGALTTVDLEIRRIGDPLIVPGKVPVFLFGSKCHPTANVRAEYSLGDVTLACAGCGAELCKIAVADR